MGIQLKENSTCRYDALALGEVMLRFDPGDCRIKTARSFDVYEGGGEYNVIRALSKVFGMKAAVVTATASNEIGSLIESMINAGGVDASLIIHRDFDGVGKSTRNALNFVERGFGLRGALGVSDRANSASSQIKCGEVDWEYIFGTLGVRWFHTGGIFASLALNTAETVLEAVKCAKKHGTAVSFDFNYRPSVWRASGNADSIKNVFKEIIGYTDVVFGNEFDLINILGFESDGSDLSVFNKDRYKKYMDIFTSEYPNVKFVFTTFRKIFSASVNDWGACGFSKDNGFVEGTTLEKIQILDRVGGGDGFDSGVIYTLMNNGGAPEAIKRGVCHGALVMTTPGDTSSSSLIDIENLMNGADAKVIR